MPPRTAPGALLPLDGVRVLECGDTIAVAYAGRHLSDLGADVVKVEGPAGDPLRRLGPFVAGIPNRDMSGGFAYFNAGKRSLVAADLGGTDPVLRALATRADVVLRSTTAGDDWLADTVLAELEAEHPGLIVADISTFGRQEGEGRHPTNDLLALAAGGLLAVNASEPTNPKASPLRYRGELSSVHAGSDAVLAVLGALFERASSGRGQRIDVSAQAAVTAILATALSRYTYTGTLPVRNGTRSVSPWGFYQCRDGRVLIQCTEDAEFLRLVELFGDPEWGHLEIFATTKSREPLTDVLDTYVNEELASLTRQEFLDKAFEYRVPAAPINYAKDILAWDHLAVRHFLDPVVLTDGRRRADVPVPGRPWRYRGETLKGRSESPRLGGSGPDADADAVWPGPAVTGDSGPGAEVPIGDSGPGAEVPTGDSGPGAEVPTGDSGPGAEAARGPLAGVRVIDLTWVWAGPYAAMQLAHLGAEVIKIETASRVDVTRRLGPFVDDEYGIDRSGYYNQYNQGKKSVALNLKEPRAMELLRQLLATADIVIDNMSAGALDRMGLPYEELVAINPRIVAVSMTGFGESGPYRDHLAYGSLIDAMSGSSSANGLVGGGPTDLVMSLPDPTAGIHAAVAAVGALYRARRTGVGARVECSMLEAFMAAFPWPVIFGGVTGHDAPVIGNRDELRCPHEVFRGPGEDEWLALAVEDDQQFARLAAVMGQPELATDPRFVDLDHRRLHEDELEAILGAWVAGQDVAAAAAALQAAGVPAEAVAHMDDVVASGPLARRAFFTSFPHPAFGVRPLAGVPWLTSRSRMIATTAAPVLGQHTREVLSEILGLSDEEIDRLAAEGVAA